MIRLPGNASADPRPVATRSELRLGVYVDTVFRHDGDRLFTNSEAFPFMLFVAEVARGFRRTVAVGRTVAAGAGTEFELPAGFDLAPLPYYENLRQVGAVGRAVGGTLSGMWRALSNVDVAWIFGPHPLALVFAGLALIRGRRVVLGVRQDTMSYFRARLPGRGWVPMLAPLWLLDRAFRALARFVPTIVVGTELEQVYGGPRARLMRATISLTRSDEIVAESASQDWQGRKQLITVARIEPEKNPMLLVDALAELERRRPGEYSLTWVGAGRMAEDVRERANLLGVGAMLELPGFVRYGPHLLDLYRSAHIFVHVSLTEGSPQVLVEAMAAATPVVATDVGSVGDTLEGGRAGLIVAPGDRDALVEAVLAVCDDPERRRERVERGLAIARRYARDVEAARIASFIIAPAAAPSADALT